MGYFANVEQARCLSVIQDIDAKLDDIEEMVAGLPMRPWVKKIIVQKIYDLYTEIEGAVEIVKA